MTQGAHSRVTVFIPTRNRSAWVRDAIESVLEQTYTDFGMVVMDNASSDGTREVVASINDPRLEYRCSSHDIGPVGNFNRCLQSIDTKYALILCDDDLLRPQHLELTVDVLEQNPCVGAVYTACDVIGADGEVLRTGHSWNGLGEDTVESGSDFIRRAMPCAGSRAAMSTMLMRRTAIPSSGFNPKDLAACDLSLWLQMATQSEIAFLCRSLGAVRVHDCAISAQQGVLWHVGYIQGLALARRVRDLKLEFLRTQSGRFSDTRRLRGQARRAARTELVLRARALAERDGGVWRTLKGIAESLPIEPLVALRPDVWRLVLGTLRPTGLRVRTQPSRSAALHSRRQGGGSPSITERLVESERNRLLRQVDWRFLLSISDTGLVGLSSGAELERAVRLVFSRTSELGELQPASADLVVLERPSPATLAQAVEALRPGGACYVAHQRGRLGVHRFAVRRLVRAGLDGVTTYWVWPRPTRGEPQVWLPLDAPEAVDYYLSAGRRARSFGGRLVRRVSELGWRVVRHAGALAPVVLIAWKSSECSVEDHLSKPAASHVDDRSSFGTRWLLLTPGRHSTNKVIALPFSDTERRPTHVLKVARAPVSDTNLLDENRALSELETRRPDLRGVPRAKGQSRANGRVAVRQTFVPGCPMFTSLDIRSFPRLALDTTNWLVALAGTPSPSPREEWWERLVADPLRRFEDLYASALDPESLAETHETLRGLGALPLVFEHRDLAPWNVLIGPDAELSVIDWERGEPQGLPVLDLAYFLTIAATMAGGELAPERVKAAHASLSLGTTPLGVVAARCLDEYRMSLGLRPDDVRALRLLAWVDHAGVEYQRELAGGTGWDPAKSLFLALWRQELACVRAPARS